MNAVINFTSNAVRNLSARDRASGPRVVLAYAKLHVLAQLNRVFPVARNSVTLLGYDVEHVGLDGLLYLFEEIFMQRSYFFEAATLKPRILDCGSNLGLSVLYFKTLYPSARITAFEPDPGTFALLSRNISRNGLIDVELRNEAIGDRNGEMTFYRNPLQEASLVASLYQNGANDEATVVDVVQLSKFINEPVDFLKMDIEGAEDLAFSDLESQRALEKIDRFVVEFHHNRETGPSLPQILSRIENEGFRYSVSAVTERKGSSGSPQDILLRGQRPLPLAEA